MSRFLNIADEIKAVSEIKECLSHKTPVLISGVVEQARPQLAEALRDKPGVILVIAENEAAAQAFVKTASFFGGESVYFPAKDVLFYGVDMHGDEVVRDRLKVIRKLLDYKKGKHTNNFTVVTTPDALLDRLIDSKRYEKAQIQIKLDDERKIEDLTETLVSIGYERKDNVEIEGDFAIRGGIADIFPLGDDLPVRMEFWGDEVSSIRTFDPESQRSIKEVKSVKIFPATEAFFSKDEITAGEERLKKAFADRLNDLGDNKTKKTDKEYERCNRLRRALGDFERTGDWGRYISFFEKESFDFLDYAGEDALVVFDEPALLTRKSEEVIREYRESVRSRLEEGYSLKEQTDYIGDFAPLYKKCEKSLQMCIFSMFGADPEEISVSFKREINTAGAASYNGSFELLVKDLEDYVRQKYKICLIAGSKSREKRLIKDLQDLGIEASKGSDLESGKVTVMSGGISGGFLYKDIKTVFISESDIFKSEKRKKKRKVHINIADLDISPGDYVVHEDHGIGIYRGIQRIEAEGVERDYAAIDYKGSGKLYVLATQVEVLQKYANADTEAVPKINSLGSSLWSRTKSKAKAAAEEIASDLVSLYAERMKEKGFPFDKDTAWQQEFEDMFPFEETYDQLEAVKDVKADMESDRIMDRLICGDVGFGKTEVAMRAAFKAVSSGKQVAFLAPTTILARQQYMAFIQRFSGFPVRIAHMSGFRTGKENKEIAKGLSEGVVDIVVGTHRILSSDVTFKDLGLLIIDEEQRFGVAQKEKIKKLKKNVDVIALSATPIPRTLNMSLVGIRDMSTLEEPPVDRKPVQTFVTEENDELIKEAINRELSRGGQVYYVINRVNGADAKVEQLKKILPEAEIAVAHGQMDKKSLEKVMLEFVNGEIDVLVATTIIETGMDISNVNTIIIENADKFGLSQIYQLRGRIGRAQRTSYAFLMFKRGRVLSEVAIKRLNAIREMTDLGSGFKLAMKDLEIRGAGNMLGKSQHGHIAGVGFEMYMQMINEAVAKLKGEPVEISVATKLDINIDAYIPADYIARESGKMEVYKKISCITGEEEGEELIRELEDRFGPVPESVDNLIKIAVLKSAAKKAFVAELKAGESKGKFITRIEFDKRISEDILKNIKAEAEKMGDRAHFSEGEKDLLVIFNDSNDFNQYYDEVKTVLTKIA